MRSYDSYDKFLQGSVRPERRCSSSDSRSSDVLTQLIEFFFIKKKSLYSVRTSEHLRLAAGQAGFEND